MMKANILLVDDDITLSHVVRNSLKTNGYNVIFCYDGETAYKNFINNKSIDICLLDVMLPGMDGMSLASKIREIDEDIPILLLTSKNMDDDKMAGFRSGADDYIVKPFNMQELLLYMEVFLKRASRRDYYRMPYIANLGNVEFNYNALTLKYVDIEKSLTQREGDLLRYLCSNANKILTREEILLNVWGKDDYFLGRSMEVFIKKIRKYIKDIEGVTLENVAHNHFKFTLPE